jgi:hypothetical protein
MTSSKAVSLHWPSEIGGSKARALSALKITFGMDDAFTSVRGSSLSQLKRQFSLKLENRGFSAIREGRIIIDAIDPAGGHSVPFAIKSDISLAPGDHIFAPLVRYE